MGNINGFESDEEEAFYRRQYDAEQERLQAEADEAEYEASQEQVAE